jgi:hypothetical protein
MAAYQWLIHSGSTLFGLALVDQVLAFGNLMPDPPLGLLVTALAASVMLVVVGSHRRTEAITIVPVREAFVHGTAFGAQMSAAQAESHRRADVARVLKMPTGAWLAGGMPHPPPARNGARHRSATPRPRRRP